MSNARRNEIHVGVVDSRRCEAEYEVEGHPWASEEGCVHPASLTLTQAVYAGLEMVKA